MFEELLERCLEKMPDDMDTREGSVAYTLLAPLCFEISNFYFEMTNLLELSFVGTAYDEYLDRIGEMFNVTRNSAQKNIKLANIVSSADILGEVFYVDAYQFTVISHIEDDNYLIEANDYSLDFNYVTGEITPVLNAPLVDSAYIIENYSLACEAEEDEDYRTRITNKINVKPYGGNIADYEEKALDIAGVSFAKVFTAFDDAPGNVNIVVACADKSPVSDTLLDTCNDYFNGSDDTVGIAPIGHTVITHTANFVDLDISLAIQTNADFENTKTLALSNISDYISNFEFENTLISLNKILAQVFLDPNVLDISSLTINGLAENFILTKEFTNFEVPRIVNFSVVSM